MREIRLSGSVRGVRSNPYPYRDPIIPVQSTVLIVCSADDAGVSLNRPLGNARRWPPLASPCGISLSLRRHRPPREQPSA